MFKKLFICGASLLMVASVGTSTTNVSARRYHHSRKALVSHSHRHGYRYNNAKRTKQFKSVQKYLRFVARYNRTHVRKWHSYFLRHLGRYMNYLNYSQKKALYKQLTKVNKVRFARKSAKRIKRTKRIRRTYRKRTITRRFRHGHRFSYRKSYRKSRRFVAKKHSGRRIRRHTRKQRVNPYENSNQDQATPSNPYWDENGYPTNLALNEAATDLINDINNDREENGINPLNTSDSLAQIAQQRAAQLFSDGFTHYDDNGNMYLTDDAANNGDSLGNEWAENIANTDGYTDQSPQDIADTFNTMLFTNEKGATPDQDGGHRKNILNPNLTNVGVGITTDNNGNTNVAEDFDNYSAQNNDNDSTANDNNNGSAGTTIHRNGLTITYTNNGLTASDNNGNTASASGPGATVNIDGQTLTV